MISQYIMLFTVKSCSLTGLALVSSNQGKALIEMIDIIIIFHFRLFGLPKV